MGPGVNQGGRCLRDTGWAPGRLLSMAGSHWITKLTGLVSWGSPQQCPVRTPSPLGRGQCYG